MLFHDARYLSKGLNSLYLTVANIKRYTVFKNVGLRKSNGLILQFRKDSKILVTRNLLSEGGLT